MLIPILAFIAGIFAISTAAVIFLAVNAPSLDDASSSVRAGHKSYRQQLAGPKGRRTSGKTVQRGIINRPHLAK
ncbi:MAG: hypothetical protein P1U77_26865 [Rubripirellula sp.]|jgi:hypothetical protein|nr:hypothetical protein [Planctomycetaceae bacterium]MDF1845052.1 hypothetical protein [Rubripirellula sp.]